MMHLDPFAGSFLMIIVIDYSSLQQRSIAFCADTQQRTEVVIILLSSLLVLLDEDM